MLNAQKFSDEGKRLKELIESQYDTTQSWNENTPRYAPRYTFIKHRLFPALSFRLSNRMNEHDWLCTVVHVQIGVNKFGQPKWGKRSIHNWTFQAYEHILKIHNASDGVAFISNAAARV